MKIAVVVVAALAALGLAACAGDEEQGIEAVGGLASGELAAAVGTAQGGLVEGITVTGSGKATLVPDVAEWSFGVQTDADTAAAALAANSEAMEGVLTALRGAGIDKKDLRTEQVSVYPRTSDDGRSVVGYTATNTV
ncbi:MAG: SIMPL domain-containing protein, partial [Gaiellaceae bacterium]